MESTAVTAAESFGRYVHVDDLHLHVVEDGNPAGVPVVLVHGFAGSTFCWRHQIAPLADAGYRVLAIDLPGFGMSSRPAGGVAGHGALAAALAGALRALHLPPAHLVAHSMGGYVASLVTLQHPDLVRSLTLVDAAIFRYPHLPRPLAGLIRAVKGPLAAFLDRRMAKPKSWERLLRNSYAGPVPLEALEGYARPFLVGGIGETMFSLLTAPARAAVADDVHRITCPVQLLWGERDTTTPLADGYKLQAALVRAPGGARLATFPTGHHPMETCPEAFSQELLSWLDEAAGARTAHTG
jgi:pimeloyl-ACP methyl ester carboxylesterase